VAQDGEAQPQQTQEGEDAAPSGDPNPTLYIRNLKEKIKKQDLVIALRELFSQCGKIKKILVRRGFAFKGQVSAGTASCCHSVIVSGWVFD